MSILARIHANGGEVSCDKWNVHLRQGRLTANAVAWIKAHKWALLSEYWDVFDAWDERAAIKEYDAGMTRAESEQAAYAEVTC